MSFIYQIDKGSVDHPPLSDLLKEGPKVPPSDPAFLSGGGEMGERMRAFDWSETALGSIENWSPALRMMTCFLLSNRFPLLL